MTKQEILLRLVGAYTPENEKTFTEYCNRCMDTGENGYKLTRTLKEVITQGWLDDVQDGKEKTYAVSFGGVEINEQTGMYLSDSAQFILDHAEFCGLSDDGHALYKTTLNLNKNKLECYFYDLEGDDGEMYDARLFDRCAHCGRIVPCDDLECVKSRYDEYWCEDCIETDAFRCDDCDQYFDESRYNRYETPNGYACEYCFSEYWTTCERCGEVVAQDEICYNEATDENLCRRCLDDVENQGDRIREYHNNPTRHFHKLHGENCKHKYIGCEIETECGDVKERRNITAKYGEQEYYIYQMHDGSLDSSGIECITQPMSKRFFDRFPFEKWFKELTDIGARSHDTDECGLHVHLSKEWFGSDGGKQELTAGTTIAIMGKLKPQLQTFARRTGCFYCRYPDEIGYSLSKQALITEALTSISHKKFAERIKKIEKCSGDRYECLNTTNAATYEFRIFRGTLNPATFRASVALCLRLVDYAKYKNRNHSRDYSWQQFKTFKRLPKVLADYIALKKL